jgi:membrane protein
MLCLKGSRGASDCPSPLPNLINTTVDDISKNSSSGKLPSDCSTHLVCISGMEAIIEGLNVAYDVKETRAWWRRTVLAILLTIALAVLIQMKL